MFSRIMMIIITIFLSSGEEKQDTFSRKREEMVRSQLISRGISSKKVLDAFRKVPRHLFVPDEYKEVAYADRPLPLSHDQTISQPYIVAYMTEILDIQPGHKILEIGTGSGYQAAILHEMEAEVYSVEIIRPLSDKARSTLLSLGYDQIHLKTGDGYKGWSEFAPFHGVLVTCSPSEIPPPLIEQLGEGGKMIIPVGKAGYIQYLYLVQKINGKIKMENVMPVRFVPMKNEKRDNY